MISRDIYAINTIYNGSKRVVQIQNSSCVTMCSTSSSSSLGYKQSKQVWIWTESKQVMTTAVERGWNTFIFSPRCRELAHEWSSTALIYPIFAGEGELLDSENRRVATISEVSSPEDLQKLQPDNEQAENVIINLLDWQIIPVENIVAALQGTQKTVFGISRTSSEAQLFLEDLEQGLGGVVLKVEDVKAILELKKE